MTLYEKIYLQLKAKILNNEFDIEKPLPTEMALQKEYGVSRITVKQAYAKLSEEGIVERIPGKGSFIKRSYKSGRRPLIGLILCDFNATFGDQLIKTIEEAAAAHGYGVVLKRSLDNAQNEEKALRELMQLKVSGIIIQNCHGDVTKNLIGLTVTDFPVVSVDRYAKGLLIPSVTSDNFGSCVQATERLLKRHHAQILFASSDPQSTSTLTERENGFKEAHIKVGAALRQEQIITQLTSPITKKPEDIARDIQTVMQALDNRDITGIIATERFVAELCAIAAEKLHRQIPEDLELICFDCAEKLLSPSRFSYIRQNENEIGRMAVKQLVLLMEQNRSAVQMRTVIPTDFIQGKSTKPFGNQVTLL
ncbi:MAG: GntR family transcriptional regulator [Eubacterium sp.]|nr:GntR family transcriptional regulator [Eubacterium sp.]